MKTVLLLGSGVTRAARPGAVTKNSPPLDLDFFDIAKQVDKSTTVKVENCLASLVGDYSASLTQSLETATTYFYIKAIDSMSGSRYHRGFLDLLSLLNRVLAHTTNSLRTGPRSLIYRFLGSELAKVAVPADLTIITFNYDLLIERVLEEIDRRRENEVFVFPGCYRLDGVQRTVGMSGAPKFDSAGYSHNGVAVLKLHGSMNWQSLHTSKEPTPRALFNPTRKLHVINSPMIPVSPTWRPRSRRGYMKPVIVPPVSGKRSMIHTKALSVWTKANRALSEADRVVIAGYSCPPLDLEAHMLLSENMRADPKKRMYLIDLSVFKQMGQMFGLAKGVFCSSFSCYAACR